MNQLGGFLRVLQSGNGLHFGLIHLQIIGVLEHIELVLPVDGVNFLVSHLAQISLHIDGNFSLLGKKGNHFWREIITQQTAQVEDLGLYMLQLLDGERICLGKHTLLTVVRIIAINILEENRIARWVQGDVYSCLEHLFNWFLLGRIHRRNERETYILWQLVDGVGKIKRGAASHVNRTARGHDFILCYVPNTTNIFHSYYILRMQRYCKSRIIQKKMGIILFCSHFNVPLHREKAIFKILSRIDIKKHHVV